MLARQPDIRGCLLPLMARGLLDGMMVRQVVAAELQQLKNGVAAQAKSPEGASPETGTPVKPSVAGSAASPAKTLDVDAADPDTKMRTEHEAFEQKAKLQAEAELDRLAISERIEDCTTVLSKRPCGSKHRWCVVIDCAGQNRHVAIKPPDEARRGVLE